MYAQGWQCINNCAVFETIGVPLCCPHCGSRELNGVEEGLERYDPYEENYINHGEGNTDSTG